MSHIGHLSLNSRTTIDCVGLIFETVELETAEPLFFARVLYRSFPFPIAFDLMEQKDSVNTLTAILMQLIQILDIGISLTKQLLQNTEARGTTSNLLELYPL